jgi:hypothetical protein
MYGKTHSRGWYLEQTGDDNYIIIDFVFVIKKKGGISIYDYELFLQQPLYTF